MSKLYTIIAGAIAAFLALIGLHKHGQKQGRQKAETKHTERVNRDVKKADDAVQKHAYDPVDARRERLRRRINKQ